MIYDFNFETIHLLNKVILFIVSMLSLWLGSSVFISNKRKKENQLFFIMSILIFLWPIFGYLTYFADDVFLAMFWVKLAYATVSLFVVVLYFFFLLFIGEEKKFKVYNIFVVTGGALLVFMSIFTNFIVESITLMEIGVEPVFCFGAYIFYLFVFSIFVFILFRLYVSYSIFSRKKRIKIQYFFIGIIIFLLLNTIFNIILPISQGNFQNFQYGNYAAIFLLAFTAYAITKHELMGVKTLITQTLIVMISIVLLADLFVLTDDLTMQLLKAGILAAFLYFSRGMIESVKKEKKARRELEKLNNKLKKANQKLEGLIEMKNEFLHITSHQLRTPLTAIRGMISMWYEGSFDHLSKRKKKEILKNICISAERLNNITNDMLNSIELEGGVFKFQFKQVSLEKVIEESINVLKFNYDKKGLYVNFGAKNRKIPAIEAEPSYVSQIFLNLIDNACKYTNKGGVDIDVRKSGKYAEITIKDTGIGVSKSDQKKIFQKFTRSKEAMIENASGSGLGLFIVEKIIKAHYGKIEFYSKGKGKGSTVKVYLPIRQE